MTTPQFLARQAAIDRLCANMLGGAPHLEGVREEYRNTLTIERELKLPVRDDERKM